MNSYKFNKVLALVLSASMIAPIGPTRRVLAEPLIPMAEEGLAEEMPGEAGGQIGSTGKEEGSQAICDEGEIPEASDDGLESISETDPVEDTGKEEIISETEIEEPEIATAAEETDEGAEAEVKTGSEKNADKGSDKNADTGSVKETDREIKKETKKEAVSENKVKPGFSRKKYEVMKGDRLENIFEAAGGSPSYEISSKTPDVAAVDEKGCVTGLKKGKATIKAVLDGKKYKASLRVRESSLSKQRAYVSPGKSTKLKLKDSGKGVSWKSSDEKIAAVKAGRVTGKSRGECDIICTYLGHEFCCRVFVNETTLTAGILNMKVGDVKQVGVYGISDPSFSENWKLKGKDNGVISVTPDGVIEARKKGKASVVTRVDGKSRTVRIRVKEKKPEEKSHVHSYRQIYESPGEGCCDFAEKVYECECGSAYVKRGERGHSFEVLESVDSTCASYGYDRLRCRVCGHSEVRYKSEEECPLKEHALTKPGDIYVSTAGDVWTCANCGKRFVLTSGGSYAELPGDDIGKGSASSSGRSGGTSPGGKPGNTSSSAKSGTTSSSTKPGSTSSSTKADSTSSSTKSESTSSSTKSESTSSSSKPGSTSSSIKPGNTSSSIKPGSTSSSTKPGSTSSSTKTDSTSSSTKPDSTSSSTKPDSTSSSTKPGSTSSSSRPGDHSLIQVSLISPDAGGMMNAYECGDCGEIWTTRDTAAPSIRIVDYDSNYPAEADRLNTSSRQAQGDEGFRAVTAGKLSIVSVEGYEFLGWSEDKNAESPAYEANRSYAPGRSLKLYGVWAHTRYAIEYENVPEGRGDNPEFYTTAYDELILKDPSRRGYRFMGWYDIEGTRIEKLMTREMRDRHLRAEWEIINYSISYNSTVSGCSPMANNPESYTVEDEDIVLNNPEGAAGMRFTGWSGSDIRELSDCVRIKSGSVGDRTYTANWSMITYRISYVLYGGENHEENPKTYRVCDSFELRDPVRKNYSFTGWYTKYDESEESRIDCIDGSLCKNLVLYAGWSKNLFDVTVSGCRCVYNGKNHSISLSCNTADTVISYRSSVEEEWSSTKPVYKDAGEYVTYYRLEKDDYETLEGSAMVIIDKAPATLNPPVAKYLVYDGTGKELVTKGSTRCGTLLFSAGSDSTGIYSESIPTAVDAGIYHVWCYCRGDENHYDSEKYNVTAEIKKAASAFTKEPAAKDLTYDGKSRALVSAAVCEGGTPVYALATAYNSPGEYSSTIPTATSAGTYYVYYRIQGDKNHEDSATTYVEVKIKKAASYVKINPQTLDLTYDGTRQELVNAGSAQGGELVYSVAAEAGGAGAYSTSIPKESAAGKYYVYYKVLGDSDHIDSEPSYCVVSIKKAAGGILSVPTALSLTYNGSAQTLINPGTTQSGSMKYMLGSSGSWTKVLPTATAAGEYTVYYYSEGDANHKDSAQGSLIARIAKKNMTLTETHGSAEYNGSEISTGTCIKVTDPASGAVIRYSLDGKTYDLTQVPKFKDIGTHKVYYRATADNYIERTGVLNAEIKKGTGVCGKVVEKDLSYNGSSQQLVGAASSSTGTVYYRIGTDGTYSTSIPTATEPGSYKVYYYSKGNDYYNDSPEQYFTARIRKAELSVSFSPTSASYDGNNHYPNVTVTSTAPLKNGEQVYVCIYDVNGTPKYYNNANYVNDSHSTSLPFTWKVLKRAEANLTDVQWTKCTGTYNLKYSITVYSGTLPGASVSPRFISRVAECTVTIK